MCVKCAHAFLKLQKKGYSRRFIEYFFWNQTAYPMGDNALERVRAFLAVPRRERRRWLRRQDRLADRAMRERDRDDLYTPPMPQAIQAKGIPSG